VAFAEYPFATVPFAGLNLDELLSLSSAGPFTLRLGVTYASIVELTVDDPDGGSAQLDDIAGALPPGISINRVLPFTGAVPYIAIISGAATLLGSYSVTYEADDGLGTTDQKTLLFEVVPNSLPPSLSRIMGDNLSRLLNSML
jgi:hypothetical protein